MRRPYLPDLLHFDDLLFSEGRKKTKLMLADDYPDKAEEIMAFRKKLFR